MDFYCTAKQIILLLLFIQTAPPLLAFGYAKCFLTFENLQYANCIGQRIVNLVKAVQHLPNTTQWLNVSQNVIQIVQNKAFFHLPNLLELRLNRNNIYVVESSAFHNLNNLRILDLSYNAIKSLDNWDMTDLADLRILNIQQNKIITIQSKSLTPLYQLQELDLSFNKICNFTNVAEALKESVEISRLNLSFNKISNLSTGQNLIALQSVNILDLSNNLIANLDLSYLYMPNLTGLMVTKNNLSAINVHSFTGVPKLALINFDENPLKMSSLLGIQLPYLTELHWSSMKLHNSTAACQVFKSLPKLQDLYLMRSLILHSDIGEIGTCTNLTTLILSTSPLRNLTNRDLQMFRYTKVLYLNKCKIGEIHNSTWIGLESLHTLILERNRLKKLQDKLFSPLVGLRYLDLSKNYLTDINRRSFHGLRNLKTLILKSCKISSIKHNDFTNLASLRFLDIQDNSISSIKKTSFSNLKRLEILLLSGNKIHSLQSNSFKKLYALKMLAIDNNNIYKISDATFNSKALRSLNISRNMLTFNVNQTKSPFSKLKHLESLDMSYQTPMYKDRISRTLFQGLKSLKKLNVRGIPSSFFKNVSFSFLQNLTDFDMSETFQGDNFNSMVELIRKCNQTRYLNLDNNEITNLPEDIFLGFNLLENLSLKYNKLKNISEKFVKPLSNLRNLDLFMNPLLCSCENYWFQNWSELNTQVQIPLLKSYNCIGQVPYEINFINQDLSFCRTDLSSLCFTVSFVFTLLLLVTSLVTVKLKWSILYFYHLIKVWIQWRIHREKRPYTYDAYISYCSDDEDWVIEELLPHLESHGEHKYKVCFKPRDFLPGFYHIENIQDAIKNSRKTLCVVSRNYLKSQWCKIEAEIACARVFYEKEDVMLVVFLEEIPDYRLSAYHKLRKLIKQNTYINWPEDPEGNEFFWFKLRKALDSGIYEEETIQFSVID